jgi:hypothetical protein
MAIVRTEEQILSKAPIEVTLGDRPYPIHPANITRSREWRLKLQKDLADIVGQFNQKAEGQALVQGLTGALIEFPEKLADLVFAYEPSLPKETILAEATEEQICAAFSVCLTLAFPFLAQLAMVRQVVAASMSPAR